MEQAELTRLAWAFGISLAFHLLVFGTYYTGKRFEVWQRLHWPAWLQRVKPLAAVLKKPERLPPPPDLPLQFVEVAPAQASVEPPKNAQYYSSHNSKAANPEARKETDIPKIIGTQKQVPKTENVPREKFVPLQPSRPAEPAPVPQEEVKARPAQPPGDLALGKPEPKPRQDKGQAPRPRPRTLQEARLRRQDSRLPGEKMKQDGGVRRRGILSSVDAKATPFGAYDAALIEAVTQRWYALLDQRDYASDGRGRVVLQFHLHSDGRVTEVNVAENTTSEVLGLICQKAVLDPAPFAPWPSDMRRVLGETRNIQFTFFYN